MMTDHNDHPKRFLGMPYDLRRPTVERFRRRNWNPDDPRIIQPKSLGWGYSINWPALAHPFRRR